MADIEIFVSVKRQVPRSSLPSRVSRLSLIYLTPVVLSRRSAIFIDFLPTDDGDRTARPALSSIARSAHKSGPRFADS